jgi:hypothetical protein
LEVLVGGRVAVEDLVAAREYGKVIDRFAVISESVRVKGKLNLNGLAGSHVDPLVSLKGLDRSIRIVKALHINLDNLIRSHRTIIGNRHSNGNSLASLNGRTGKLGAAKRKVNIAHTKAERPHRLALEIAVSAVLHTIVLEIRKLRSRLVESNGKLSGRAYIAEQDVRNSGTALLA